MFFTKKGFNDRYQTTSINKMTSRVFNADVVSHGSYAYTTAKLSAKLSNARISKSILAMESFVGKKVLDIGCGDGAYSYELAQSGAALVVAIDPVENAIAYAMQKYRDSANLRFECVDLYEIDVTQQPYDIVVLRGVLHHLHDLEKGVEIVCRLAKKILIMEPNGYNLILKIIEKTSKYHIEHQEQSFAASKLRGLFKKNNGKIIFEEFIGLVPFFCPDWLTKIAKYLEPLVESLPFIRNVACGQYIFAVEIS